MKRRFYLDNIRSLTILLVVLYHVFYMFNGVEGCRVIGPFSDFQIQDSVQYLLYPWFMVILFIISGMCAAYYLGGHTAKEFVRERTRKLLVPSTVGLLAFQWIQGAVNARIYNIAGIMDPSVPKFVSVVIIILSGCGVLWFVQALWLFSMLLPLVVRIDKGRLYSAAAKTPVWLIVLLAVPFRLSAQVLNTPVVAVYRFGIYGFAFFAGYFLFSHEEVTDRLTKYWLPLTVVSAVLGVLYTVLHFGKNYAVAPDVNCPLACAYSWFACLSVLALGKKFLDRDGRFWSFINRNSWGIYIFHYLGASSCALLLRGSAVPPFAQYILCLLASLFVSFFLFHLISRIPFLRWCVLGMKKPAVRRQTTDTVFMVRPVAFGFNEQTSANNAFQKQGAGGNISELARRESDEYIGLLEKNGIKVVAVEDTAEPHTPDSVFPNNWFSTHCDGTLVLYPMFAENRRLERKPAALDAVRKNFKVRRVVDLTHYESEGLFLEGTGSMVLDRVNRIAYACRSPRTSEVVLNDFCAQLGYTPFIFDAVDKNGMPIYHTNVMLHVGTELAVVCMDSVSDPTFRIKLRESFESAGKTVIEITFDQMNSFAGNMLEVRSSDGAPFLILSSTAFASLSEPQLSLLRAHLNLLTPSISCIEQNGGGSARCMLAELF